ncbi:MAG: hypothetical protein FJ031_13940 [Chloroflexi bacterium]|nr:hypothetical protein [Chloroflexota bacterium]
MKQFQLLHWLSKPKNLWVTIFLYTILTGLFVQLIFLPYIFPAGHAGNGLLKGVDGKGFHKLALELSEAIKAEGWSQWDLMPGGQLVSGVAAIFYVVIYPKPWSVLPFNAILNASACLCLYLIISELMEDHIKGVIASLPFIFFPSSLLRNAQFHNENYAIPGVIFILFGWMLIARKNANPQSIKFPDSARALFFIALGSLLLGLVRLYILSGMIYLYGAMGFALGIYWLRGRDDTRAYLLKLFVATIGFSIMLFTGAVIKSYNKDSSSDLTV